MQPVRVRRAQRGGSRAPRGKRARADGRGIARRDVNRSPRVLRERPGVTHLLVGSADTNLRLWDTTSRRCLRTMRGHTAEVSALSVSPVAPDLCVSGDRGGKCLVWRFGTAGGGGGGGGGGGSRDGDSTLQRPVRALEQLDGTPVLAVAMSAARENDVAVGHQSGALGVATSRRRHRRGNAGASRGGAVPGMDAPRAHRIRGADRTSVGSRERAATLWSWTANACRCG